MNSFFFDNTTENKDGTYCGKGNVFWNLREVVVTDYLPHGRTIFSM